MVNKLVDVAQFTLSEGSGFQVHGCHGVFGGITANGSVHANFFVDTPKVPSSIRMRRGPDGGAEPFDEDMGPQDRAEYIRRLVTSVLVSPEEALNIGQWFINTGAQVFTVRGGGVALDFPNGQKLKFGVVPEE
ncbi:hypothetical protein GGR69_001892 [Xanthomonas arboricola]|nr:hypothetical protein [Xanthomonas arboricola]